ncbi:MAG: hypothetical protein LRY71_00170 [Bacillaceae bacterium]|nr:hypothetical protein [Bacillaceae bacterium]
MEAKKNPYSLTDLKQKVIYFQKEAAKYKFLADKYELLIAESLRNKEIPIERNTQANNEIEASTPLKQAECISYFKYSIIQDAQASPLIHGNFLMKNIGQVALHSPVICLKINDARILTIGGKIGEISNSDEKLISGAFHEWIYVQEDWRKKWNEDGELWLKPKNQIVLAPGEEFEFNGFDFNFIRYNRSVSINLKGYCYFAEIPSGIRSLNSISITL